MIPATVVWLPDAPPAPASEARGAAPNAASEPARALEKWANARGVQLEAATTTPARERKTLAVDLAIGDEVEADLEHARDAMAAVDQGATDAAIAHAEELLAGHPELPHAAWLMAEVERARAAKSMHFEPKDALAAARAWQRARALDGGRAPGVLESAYAASSPPDELVTVTLAQADGPSCVARLDGVVVSPGRAARASGRHQLTTTCDGALVWAAWVTLSAGVTVAIDPRDPADPAACSTEDLARASIDPRDASNVVAQGVRCAEWVAATTTPDPRAIRVALCQGARCAPLALWRAEPTTTSRYLGLTTPASEGHFHWPAWATWALVGVSVALIATTAIVESGAFATPRTDTRFVSSGVKVQGFVLPF